MASSSRRGGFSYSDSLESEFVDEATILAPLTQQAINRHNGVREDHHQRVEREEEEEEDDGDDDGELFDDVDPDDVDPFSVEYPVDASIAMPHSHSHSHQRSIPDQLHDTHAHGGGAVGGVGRTATHTHVPTRLQSSSPHPSVSSVPPPSRLPQPQFFYKHPIPSNNNNPTPVTRAPSATSQRSAGVSIDPHSAPPAAHADWKSRPTVLWGGGSGGGGAPSPKKQESPKHGHQRAASQTSMRSQATTVKSNGPSSSSNVAAAKLDAQLKFLQQTSTTNTEEVARPAPARARIASGPPMRTTKRSTSMTPTTTGGYAASVASDFTPGKVTRLTTTVGVDDSAQSTTRTTTTSSGSVAPFVSSHVGKATVVAKHSPPQVTFAPKPILLNTANMKHVTPVAVQPVNAHATNATVTPSNDGSSYAAVALKKPASVKKKKKIPIISAMDMTQFNAPSNRPTEEVVVVADESRPSRQALLDRQRAPAHPHVPPATSVPPPPTIPPTQPPYPLYTPYQHGANDATQTPISNQPFYTGHTGAPAMHGLPPGSFPPPPPHLAHPHVAGGRPFAPAVGSTAPTVSGAQPTGPMSLYPPYPYPFPGPHVGSHSQPPPPHMLMPPYGTPPPHMQHFNNFHAQPPPPQHQHQPPPPPSNVHPSQLASVSAPVPLSGPAPSAGGPTFAPNARSNRVATKHAPPARANPLMQSMHTVQEQSLLASLDRLDARLQAVQAPKQAPPPVKRVTVTRK